MLQAPPLSLYVHTPWCMSKCPYCDFNSHRLTGSEDISGYVDALLRDLAWESPLVAGRAVETVFIGGGTPSIFPYPEIDRLLSGIRRHMPCSAGMEVTLEANPGAADCERFAAYREAGVNRLSIGIQSFDAQCLRRLERIHGREEALRALGSAREAGFDNVNLDLMFGLPGQTRLQALADVRLGLQLKPEHLSYYQLTLEPNTCFAFNPPSLPVEDEVWEMQSAGQAALAAAGYVQYEVSAFSRPGYPCRHNLNYWTFGDYLGIGAGAHGKITESEAGRIQRRWRVRSPAKYLANAGTASILAGTRELTGADRELEFMMNLMRLNGDFTTAFYESRTGLDFAALETRLGQAERKGLVRMEGDSIGPTALGRRFLNDLLSIFA